MAPNSTIGYTPTTPPPKQRPKDRNPRPATRPGDQVWQFNGVWVVKPKNGSRYIVSNGRRATLPPNARIDVDKKRVVLKGEDTYIRFHSGKATINRPKKQSGRRSDSAGATLGRALGAGARQESDYFAGSTPRPSSRAPLTGERGPAGSASPRPAPARQPATPTPAAPRTTPTPAAPAAGKGTVATALDEAMKYLGTMYQWGGATPETGFDCSGLLQWAFRKAGINLPRVSKDQAGAGRMVDPRREDPKPGDLLFFDYSDRNGRGTGGVDHVGVYLGGGRMLQSPRTGKPVQIVTIDMSKPIVIRRVVPDTPQSFAGLTTKNGQTFYNAGPRPIAQGSQRVDPRQAAEPGQGGDPASNPQGTGQPAPTATGAPPVVRTQLQPDGTVTTSLAPEQGGPLPKDATDAQIKARVAEQYGYLSAFLDLPEVGPILLKAVREGWTAATLQGALSKTNWWKTTTASMRQWDSNYRLDRASAEKAIADEQARITAEAKQMGVAITPGRARDLATKVKRMGWTPQQVTGALANEIRYTSKPGQDKGEVAFGEARTTIDTLKAQARSYLVPISDQTLTEWTRKIAAGTIKVQDFESYLKEQAKSLFPGMGGAIDAGVEPSTYVQPYQQLAAQLLEINPNEVDFLNPKYGKALFQVDPKTGQRSAMSLADWQDYLRETPEYGRTKQFREQAAEFTQSLAETWGRI